MFVSGFGARTVRRLRFDRAAVVRFDAGAIEARVVAGAPRQIERRVCELAADFRGDDCAPAARFRVRTGARW